MKKYLNYSSQSQKQQSQILRISEKSQEVQCMNLKEEVHLQKQLEELTKQENSVIKQLFFDQKIVTERFRRRIGKSLMLMKSHDEMKKYLNNFAQFSLQQKNMDTKLSSRKQLSSSISHPQRPMTASEMRLREWEVKIYKLGTQLRRSKSAPAMRRKPFC